MLISILFQFCSFLYRHIESICLDIMWKVWAQIKWDGKIVLIHSGEFIGL